MPDPLPYGQLQTYIFLSQFIEEHHYSPSHREIMEGCGLKSTGSVWHRIRQLELKGYIEVDGARVRSIRLLVKMTE